ncbi:hypothetical protein EON81_05710 [bacterium]|nr:MAG: hypothetical protein EON81_05710 [bacterium]
MIDDEDQFLDASGNPLVLSDPVGDGVACPLAGRAGFRWRSATSVNPPRYKLDSSGSYLEFKEGRLLQADSLAHYFSGDPAHWTFVAIYDTTDIEGTRVLVSLDGPGNSYARLRADKTTVRGELHVDESDKIDTFYEPDKNVPLQVNLGGPSQVPPRPNRPNIMSAGAGADGYGWGRKDGGYSSVWNFALDPTDPETDLNLRRRVLVGQQAIAQWEIHEGDVLKFKEASVSTFKFLTLGGSRRENGATLAGGFVGKIYRIAVFDRKLTEPEVRGVEEWLRDSLKAPGNCLYALREGVRYVAPPNPPLSEGLPAGGDDMMHLGIVPEEPLATIAKAVPFFSNTGGKVVVRSSESNPYRGEFVLSRPISVTIEPWPGYERIWWFGSTGFPAGLTWTAHANPGVHYIDLEALWNAKAIAQSTPCIHFTTLPGPLGADVWSLRKEPGERKPEDWDKDTDPYWDPDQYNPAFGDYGWDGEAKRLYVNIGQNPSNLPFELGAGYCATAWRGRLTVRNANGRYAHNGLFGCGDGTAGTQTPIQGEADYIDCYGRNAGPAASAFFLRGHGKRIRAYRPVAAYSANDSYGAHKDRASQTEQRMELYDAVGYGAQDENLSFHEGASGGAYRFWFWNAGSGNVTSVTVREPRVLPTDSFDERPTSMTLVGGCCWSDGLLATDHGATKLPVNGITFNNRGMRGRVVGCTLDGTVNVPSGTPESYVIRAGNRENVPTAEFVPPPAREWAPYF